MQPGAHSGSVGTMQPGAHFCSVGTMQPGAHSSGYNLARCTLQRGAHSSGYTAMGTQQWVHYTNSGFTAVGTHQPGVRSSGYTAARCTGQWEHGSYPIKKYRWYHPWQKQKCIGGT